MLLKKPRSGRDSARITPACPRPADTAMPTSTTRWRMEHCFAENACLGVHHLPSLPLNAIQTRLSLRLLAFHVMDHCRHDLGAASQQQTPALLHREGVDGVQRPGEGRGGILE